MLSKSGKREWLCPNCDSPHIGKTYQFGQSSGFCVECDTWWPWKWRKNVPGPNNKKLFNRERNES